MTLIQEDVLSREHDVLDGKYETPDSIRVVKTREGLASIADTATELVIWERSLPEAFQVWLYHLAPSQLPKLRILVDPFDLRRAVIAHFDNCGMPGGEMRNFLIEDVEELVTAYARIAKTHLVDVRLERVNHDACWKFHRDFIRTRLLTTYRGPSTEWVHPQYAAEAVCDQKCFKGPTSALRCSNLQRQRRRVRRRNRAPLPFD